MKTTLTQALIRKLPVRDADIYDKAQPRLVLRTRASGRHTYRVLLGYGRWYTLGGADVLTPPAARELAKSVLGDVSKGVDPIEVKRRTRAATFDAFLSEHYEPWALTHLKSGVSFVGRIRKQFSPLFGGKPLSDITPWAIEKWRSARLRAGVSAATANRDLVALKASLSKAVQWRLISEHPLRAVRPSKEDSAAIVRYLINDEEQRLREELATRDERRQAARAAANAWRRERGYPELPEMRTFSDHLTPIVLLALNTGLRRGELFGLHWEDVDLQRGSLAVRGNHAKSGRTRHVPLNAEARKVLTEWSDDRQGFVFPGAEGEKMTTLKTGWLKIANAAQLVDFRFHDLRHTFASKLVQRGVDLNTVRELLGHSSFTLTLRYAHLAAENKIAAVEKLDAQDIPPGEQQPGSALKAAVR
jgi:integrase